jgi:hypothetical protein
LCAGDCGGGLRVLYPADGMLRAAADGSSHLR